MIHRKSRILPPKFNGAYVDVKDCASRDLVLNPNEYVRILDQTRSHVNGIECKVVIQRDC